MALDLCRPEAFVLVGYAAARHEVSGVEVRKHSIYVNRWLTKMRLKNAFSFGGNGFLEGIPVMDVCSLLIQLLIQEYLVLLSKHEVKIPIWRISERTNDR